jgi:hypothetical protein
MKISKNKKWLALITIWLIIIGVVCIKSYSENNIEKPKKEEAISDVKIIIYQNGEEIRIKSDASYFGALQKEVEDFLISSDNALYEAVTKETISKIKSGKAIELIYSNPVEFKINNPVYSRKVININRLLIPLEGYYFPNTIFYGNKFYSDGPFINSSGSERVERIKKLIKDTEDRSFEGKK